MDNSTASNSILGMQPALFWTIIGILGSALLVGVWAMIKALLEKPRFILDPVDYRYELAIWIKNIPICEFGRFFNWERKIQRIENYTATIYDDTGQPRSWIIYPGADARDIRIHVVQSFCRFRIKCKICLA